jgi:hypothetical protein
VRRRCHRTDAHDFSLLRVGLHERKLSAAAKVSVKRPSVVGIAMVIICVFFCLPGRVARLPQGFLDCTP